MSLPAVGLTSEQGPRPTMEDEVIIKLNQSLPSNNLLQPPISFFAVLDGHGGRAAAIYTRDHLFDNLLNSLNTSTVENALVQAYQQTDKDFEKKHSREPRVQDYISSKKLFEKFQPQQDRSGTCAVSCLIEHNQNKLWCANAGDSRAILVRKCNGVLGLTKDHKATRPDEIQRIEKAGGHVVMNRVEGILAVSRSIGDTELQANDSKLVLPDPEIRCVDLNDPNTGKCLFSHLVICCDGVFDVMSNEQVAEFVKSNSELTPKEISEKLVEKCLDELKTSDNVTVLIFNLNSEDVDNDLSSKVERQSSSHSWNTVYGHHTWRKCNSDASIDELSDPKAT